MRQGEILLLLFAAFALLSFTTMSYRSILKTFLPPWEGFRREPYWDYKQWSWGYGTRVPGSVDNPNIYPSGSITEAQAMADALEHIDKDRDYLRGLITVPLNDHQWAALLSFAYNLGRGNADNLVPNINRRDNTALGTQWALYINAGGVPMEQLILRRAAEWALWIT